MASSFEIPARESASLRYRYYGEAFKRQAWLIVLPALVALTVGISATAVEKDVYRASMTFVFSSAGGRIDSDVDLELTDTMASLFDSDVVAQGVIDRLELTTSPEELGKKFEARAKPDSTVVEATFDSTGRRKALRILRAYGAVFTDLIDLKLGVVVQSRRDATTANPAAQAVLGPGTATVLPTQDQSRAGLPGASQTQPAAPDEGRQQTGLAEVNPDRRFVAVFQQPHVLPEPVGPSRTALLLLVGLLGLLFGLLLAFLRELLDDSIHDRRTAEESFGAPVIGALPKGWNRKERRINGRRRASRGPRAVDEAFILLGVNLEFDRAGRHGLAVGVTSSGDGEGKSAVVAHLGLRLASEGRDVVCVEADPRYPPLHEQLKIDWNHPGLMEVVSGEASLESALVTVPVAELSNNANGAAPRRLSSGSLRVLTIGDVGWNSLAPFTRPQVARLVTALRDLADITLIDLPSLEVSEGLPFVSHADNVLLVERRDRTTVAKAEAARHMLARLGARNVGVVLTDVDDSDVFL